MDTGFHLRIRPEAGIGHVAFKNKGGNPQFGQAILGVNMTKRERPAGAGLVKEDSVQIEIADEFF